MDLAHFLDWKPFAFAYFVLLKYDLRIFVHCAHEAWKVEVSLIVAEAAVELSEAEDADEFGVDAGLLANFSHCTISNLLSDVQLPTRQLPLSHSSVQVPLLDHEDFVAVRMENEAGHANRMR